MTARLVGSLLVFAFASPLAAEVPSDAEAAKMLIGSWVVPHDQLTILTEDGGLTFKSDGTFASYGIIGVGGREQRLEMQGKWSVEDGVLIEELTASSDAQRAPVGWTTRDALLAVTDKEYRFRTADKAEYTYRRK